MCDTINDLHTPHNNDCNTLLKYTKRRSKSHSKNSSKRSKTLSGLQNRIRQLEQRLQTSHTENGRLKELLLQFEILEGADN